MYEPGAVEIRNNTKERFMRHATTTVLGLAFAGLMLVGCTTSKNESTSHNPLTGSTTTKEDTTTSNPVTGNQTTTENKNTSGGLFGGSSSSNTSSSQAH